MSLSRDEARAFHDEVCVLDLHADTPKLMDRLEFDLAERHERPLPRRLNYVGHVDLPRMRDGGFAGQFFGMWTVPYPERGTAASIHRQLDSIDAAIARNPEQIAWAMTPAQIRAAKQAGMIAALAGVEGGHALEGNLAEIERFAVRGVRYLGLLHLTASTIGAPAGGGLGMDPTRGLSDYGRQVVAELERCGVVVDLAHINRVGFFDALDVATRPPMVTHTGVLGVHQHWRNIDDEQIRAVADRGGCVGIIFAKRYLGGATLDAVVDHILHVISVAGADVPALGSDFDGFVVPPDGLEDASCLPNLTAALSQRGVSKGVLEKILGGNVLRVLGDVAPTSWLAAHADAA